MGIAVIALSVVGIVGIVGIIGVVILGMVMIVSIVLAVALVAGITMAGLSYNRYRADGDAALWLWLEEHPDELTVPTRRLALHRERMLQSRSMIHRSQSRSLAGNVTDIFSKRRA
jgi:hypothetical protein